MQTLNKNNLHVNEETCNHFPSPLASSNMFTTTYYPANLSKYDFHPDSPCRAYLHSWKAAEPPNSPKHHGEVFSLSKKNKIIALGVYFLRLSWLTMHQSQIF